jgi:hypothetical protein
VATLLNVANPDDMVKKCLSLFSWLEWTASANPERIMSYDAKKILWLALLDYGLEYKWFSTFSMEIMDIFYIV